MHTVNYLPVKYSFRVNANISFWSIFGGISGIVLNTRGARVAKPTTATFVQSSETEPLKTVNKVPLTSPVCYDYKLL